MKTPEIRLNMIKNGLRICNLQRSIKTIFPEIYHYLASFLKI